MYVSPEQQREKNLIFGTYKKKEFFILFKSYGLEFSKVLSFDLSQKFEQRGWLRFLLKSTQSK